MTDEEIEKALREADDLAISEDVDCYAVLIYIRRLKLENTRLLARAVELDEMNEDLARNLEEKNEEIERVVRAETVKKFAEILLSDEYIAYNEPEIVKEVARKFGVEV